jgi:cytochrome c oxidase subunit 1
MNLTKTLKYNLIVTLFIPMVVLILGIYHGLLQTLYRAGIISSTSFFGLEYYQGLTIHGVVNALVLTTFFAVAFGNYIMAFYMKKSPNGTWVTVSTLLMVVGTLLAAFAMLEGSSSVLYTFYPPMKAAPLFYIGATLLVVGSWIPFFVWLKMYSDWKKENPGVKLPLAVLGNLANFIIWFICTLPLAYEVLVLLLPWSLGWVEGINIPLSRTLFWFFGHALVYFWLLPSYIAFYTILPKIAGGKLYSENAGKLVFLLFILFSIPVGTHHQFSEPAIREGVKFFHSILTYGVAIPSFITAFTIAASLEYAAKKRGSKGLFSWMSNQPYFDSKNYLFAYFISGLILFFFGGLSGLVNASYSLNNVVHNTAWIPGHFHMTVAGPVFLSILGLSLYILTKVMGKEVKFPALNQMVPYLWVMGVLIFSTGLMWGGLIGEPRRTNMGTSYLNPDSPFFNPSWVPTTALAVIGGILMTISALAYFVVFFGSVFGKKVNESEVYLPVSESYHKEKYSPYLENLKPWVVAMIALIMIAYIPAIQDTLKYSGADAPPFKPDNPIPLELYQQPKDLNKE